MNENQVTKLLKSVGACWAVRSDKFCSPDDPLEAQIKGEKTYHIHPDASNPQQSHILRFRSLRAIAIYCKARQEATQARNQEEAIRIMEDAWAELEP